MQERFSQQLKKGLLEMLVLGLLCKESSHGYRLRTQLDQLSGGMFSLKEGTLYPILYRLEDDGMIVSRWEFPKEGRGAPKKTYAVTQKGLSCYQEQRKIWAHFKQTIDDVCKESTEK